MLNAMTKQGRDWFTLAMDPFHDYETHVAGFPDPYHDSTVVFYDKVVHKIRKPSNLPAGETWSAHVCTGPVMKSDLFYPFFNSKLGDVIIDEAQVLDSFGTVNVRTAQDGVPTFPTDEPDLAAYQASDPNQTRSAESFGALEKGFVGMGRLVAGGFEVHNDTPDLFKGGSVTVYSAPQESSESYAARVSGNTFADAATIKNHKGIPATLKAASLYRSSRTWEAKDGVLVPFQLNLAGSTMDYKAKPSLLNMFRSGEGAQTGGILQQGNILGTPGLLLPDEPTRPAPLDTSGAYFTGLNENTVLTLSIKFFTEVAPSVTELSLLKLSSPSAEYDSHAINCYNHCVATLPPGVPVGFNDMGKWWRMVLTKLKEQAPRIVPQIIGSAAASFAPELAPIATLVANRTKGRVVTKALNKAIENSQARSDARAKRSRAPKAKSDIIHRK